MATILKIVGGNIRRMRKLKRLTLEQLAEKAESNPKYLGGVERGEENIGLRKLAQVAAALHVDPYELLLPGGEGELTDELIASIRTADSPTQALILDIVQRVPAWKEILSATRKRTRSVRGTRR
jgi:transcriptional regulator with XRE-family HTH domain